MSLFASHIQTYCCGPTAVGWGLGWLNAPWLCEWWCSHTWDGHGMVMGVSTGNIPKGGSRGLKALPSVTAPALAKPWHALSQMLWPKKYAKKNEKTLFTGWKVVSPRDLIEALQLRPTNQKKLFSLWKVLFLKEHRRDVLGKGTSPVIPQSRINEARWNVAHTN